MTASRGDRGLRAGASSPRRSPIRLLNHRCITWCQYPTNTSRRRIPCLSRPDVVTVKYSATASVGAYRIRRIDPPKASLYFYAHFLGRELMTRTGEYALRAMIFIAQSGESNAIPGRAIAKETGIPLKYLQKILGDLTRCGMLTSAPGKTGGFQLCRPARRITLRDVLAPFERLQTSQCPFANTVCSDSTPCRAHSEWKKVVETERRFFKRTTIADVAAGEPRNARRPKATDK